ncbi:D-amino-acid transaminase [Niallia sp. XMNu-256]|uniref:D-amino-acid transaminase n=1 Tax=Niallia sp. XMNu-256 TaxID=3082444 RepID=UPI0030CF62E3
MGIGYINGKYIPLTEPVIPIEERGHQYGDGVYEVIRVYKGKPFMLSEHIDRLFISATAIKLQLECNKSYFNDLIKQAIKVSGLLESKIYLQITRGIAPRNHLFPDVPVSITMTVNEMIPLDPVFRESGVKAIFHEDERWANCHIKSLNLLPNILAKQAAQEMGCFEAILHRDGWITEGSSSNIFIVKNNELYTTPLSNKILAGITRRAVIQLCEKLSINVIQHPFRKKDLIEADEVFMTNTTNEVVPIVEVDGIYKIGFGTPGNMTKRLYQQFQQEIYQD